MARSALRGVRLAMDTWALFGEQHANLLGVDSDGDPDRELCLSRVSNCRRHLGGMCLDG